MSKTKKINEIWGCEIWGIKKTKSLETPFNKIPVQYVTKIFKNFTFLLKLVEGVVLDHTHRL